MKNQSPIIVECKIGSFPRKMPKGMFDPMPKVNVKLSNGEEKELFEFYPDEIDFIESEFIGLTIEEAKNMKYHKDIEFLRS